LFGLAVALNAIQAWLMHLMQFGEENLSTETLAGPSLRLVNGSNRKSK